MYIPFADPAEMESEKWKESSTKSGSYKVRSNVLEVPFKGVVDFLTKGGNLGTIKLPISDEVTVTGKLKVKEGSNSKSYFMVFKFTNKNVSSTQLICDIRCDLIQEVHDLSTPWHKNLFKNATIKSSIGKKETKAKSSPTFFLDERPNCVMGQKFVIQFNEISIEKRKLEYDDTAYIDDSQMLTRMYEDDSHKDLKFVIYGADGEKTVMAHKCVVAAQNEVFRAMLKSDMQEKIGVVEIKDTDIEVFRAFIKYLYTRRIDDIENLDTIAIDLMRLSDKYMDRSLQVKCEKYICSALNRENVIQYFIAAHLNNFEQLERIAIKNIKHFIQDIPPPALKQLDPYPELLRKIIQEVGGMEGTSAYCRAQNMKLMRIDGLETIYYVTTNDEEENQWDSYLYLSD